MKKHLISMLLLLIAAVSVNAQILRAEELEKYSKEKYGKKWVSAATNLSSQLSLDKHKGITYTQIIPSEGKTKEELYIILNYWFTATFNDANSVIKLNDKELGTIIAQGYVEDIAQQVGGMSTYNVNIKPIIKCDIKDSKVRVTYTIPYYIVTRMIGGGWMSAFAGNRTPPTRSEEKWSLDECFPFIDKNKDKHLKASCKALVMTHAYSNVVMDKIEECIKEGLIGNESDNW